MFKPSVLDGSGKSGGTGLGCKANEVFGCEGR
jgi:hypothetical protein